MPIYSYECKDCGEKFDMLVGVGTGGEELKCKKCNSKRVQKVPTTFSFTINGGSSGSCPTGTCNLD